MDDLVSRQAAIDALKAMAVPRYKDPACEDIWERDRTLDRAIDVMRGLPSAQSDLIRCKDCKWKQGSECVMFAEVRPFPDDFCSRAER